MNNDSKAMYDILTKLHQANPRMMNKKVEVVANDLIEAADADVDLKVALTSKIEESSVTVQNYRIDIVLNEFAGREKRFYNIVETGTNRIVHQDLALFETAMGIVKKYITGKDSYKIRELEKYDMEYTNALYEIWMHQSRARKGINENVALAKASNAKAKVADAKRKILQKL